MGKPRIVQVIASDGYRKDDILRYAAGLEQASEHPLAAANVGGARERSLPLGKVESFRSLTGKGVAGKVDGREVALRIPALFSELGIAIGRLAHEADEARREGRTVMFLSLDRKPAGLLSVADPIKCANYQIMR